MRGCVLGMTSRPAHTRDDEVFAVEARTLANGLCIVHVPMPTMPSVAVNVFVGAGSRHERTGQEGAAHLVEHMLFKGTYRRPSASQLSQTLDAVGGVLNAATDKDLTTYWAKVAKEHLSLAIDCLSDMLLCSRVTTSDVTKEKGVVIEELRMLADDPQDRVHVLAEEVLWPDQPVGREIAGTPDTVARLSRADVRGFMREHYGPNNAVVGVAGGVGLEDVTDLLARHFDGWEPVTPEVPTPARVIPDGARHFVECKRAEQVQVCVVFQGVARRHPDRPALDVLATLLGGGTSSRLFRMLRDELGLAYDVHAYTGSFVIYVGVEEGKVIRALSAITNEINRLSRRRVPEAELDRTKRFMRGRLWLALEEPQAVASWFGAQQIVQDEMLSPEQVVDETSAVSTDDLRRLTRTILAPDVARLAVVGPIDPVDLPWP